MAAVGVDNSDNGIQTWGWMRLSFNYCYSRDYPRSKDSGRPRRLSMILHSKNEIFCFLGMSAWGKYPSHAGTLYGVSE